MSKPVKKENPNAFKLWIGKELLVRMGQAIQSTAPSFDQKQFIAIDSDLKKLELKPRVQLVRDQLKKQLPADYPKALAILLSSLKSKKLSGFDLWPYTEFVQTYGLDHPQISLDALQQLTQIFTSEFAVRPFLKKHTVLTLNYLKKCARDSNSHMRRWASEGSRPRLPWGERLDIFIQDPHATLPILESLKHDAELYVRKSVANHLNDIAKDHPSLVVATLKKWLAQAKGQDQENVQWITKQALRTLIKMGNPGAMALLGAKQKVNLKTIAFKMNRKAFKVNDRLEFAFDIHSQANKPQKIIVDYIIHYVKANKGFSAKVYKLKTFTLNAKQKVQIKKSHHLKLITTRRYYPGTHILELQINGRVYEKSKWTLA